MKVNEFFKHNFVLIPVIASVIFGTVTGIKYVIDLTNTIDANNQRVEKVVMTFHGALLITVTRYGPP